MSETDDRSRINQLKELGATVKLSKRSSILSVDFRTATRAVGDDDLALITTLPKLRELYLDSSLITNAGLEHLEKLTALQTLDLQNTAITDEGLLRLKPLAQLKLLLLTGSRVTREAVAEARKQMLNTRIVLP